VRGKYKSHSRISFLILAVLLCTLFTGWTAFAQSPVEAIIQRSVEANNRDWKADPEYSYFERDVQNGVTKSNQVMMIEGSPYYRLTEVNDKPLSKEEQAKEEQKLQQAMAQRRSESPQQRAARIAQFEKDRKRDHLLMEQLTKAFNFTLEGEEKFGPYEVYVLQATPRAGYVPPNRETRVLTGMNGKLWIDKQTYQWVKVEAQVVHPVSIEGFLARVEPGTRFELEKTPVTDGIWLPKHFAMKAHAKILLMVNHNTQEEDTYWGYQKQPPNPATEATQQFPKR
jgi:hypothetical protein